MADVIPEWNGKPITPGFWWLQFPDGPGPYYWDGTFWKRGSYFAGPEDLAAFPILGPCVFGADAALREALTEVMAWIDNWDPSFTQDPEWPDTKDKVQQALKT